MSFLQPDSHRRVYYDTEFYEDGERIHLISIGMVDQDGDELYLENADFDWRRVPDDHWIQANVRPHLLGRDYRTHTPYENIRDVVASWLVGRLDRDFLGPGDGLWGYYSAYDHVALCQLFGTMMDLPTQVPMFTQDIKQEAMLRGVYNLDAVIPKEGTEHNALADALWNKSALEWLEREYGK